LILAALVLALLPGACGGRGTTPQSDPPPPAVDFAPANPRLASASLLSDLQYLCDPAREGRKLGSSGNAQARGFLAQRFAQLGLEPLGSTYEWPFTWRNTAGVNVVGRLAGTRHPQRTILISAHFDHVGIRNGNVYPGADDNASGSAALLQLAGWLKAHPPAHTVLFCLFDGEEAGLYGSQAFVAAPPVPLADIMVVLNLDMIAQGTKGRIFVGGTSYTASLKPHLLAAYAGSKVAVVPDFEIYDAQSDQYPFMQKGIPFLFFCVGDDDPWYHTPSDRFELIPKTFYWASTEAILETFLELDGLDSLPQLLPHAPEQPAIPGERALRPRLWKWSGNRG
jgi:hypothetical protein